MLKRLKAALAALITDTETARVKKLAAAKALVA